MQETRHSRSDHRTSPNRPERVFALLASAAGPKASIEVLETSKSWIFLGSEKVYKMKKPIWNHFQDLRTVEARKANTLAEIRLNQRLAAGTYLAAVPVTEKTDGSLCLGGTGPVFEWLVEMKRLPADQMLENMILSGRGRETITGPTIDRLIGVLVEFYREAPKSDLTSHGYLAQITEQNGFNREVLLDDTFVELRPRLSDVLDRFDRFFEDNKHLIRERMDTGRIIEGHGDLRPEHICLTDPPVVFDCLEFSQALRMVDPFSEVVSLGMECAQLGADWIGPRLIRGLERGLDDTPESRLLDLYLGVHAMLRARLCLAHLLEPCLRTPEVWQPKALDYVKVAEKLLATASPKSIPQATRPD